MMTENSDLADEDVVAAMKCFAEGDALRNQQR